MTKSPSRRRRSDAGLSPEVSTTTLRRRSALVARVCIAAATVVAVLWQGAVEPTALWLVWGLAAAAWVASVPHVPIRRRHGTAGLLWIGLGGYTAFLLLPLPRALVAAVNPAAVQISDASQLALGFPSLSTLPIAISPADAAMQVAIYLICGALALLYSHGLLRPDARVRAVRDGDWLGYVCAVAAALWLLSYAPWISTVLPASLRHMVRQWSLINPNHLAGLCAVGVAFAMGRVLRSAVAAQRNTYLLLALFFGVTAVLTASRGGVLAVVFVVVISLVTIRPVWLRTRTAGTEIARRKRIDFMLKILTVSIVLTVLSIPFIEAELLPSFAQGTSETKLKFLGFAADHIGGGWLLGQGPGALPVVLGMDGATITARADFTENIFLERFIDQGIWGALPFFVILTWLLTSIARGLPRGSAGIAPWAACVGLLLQNFVDFSLEVTGGLLPFLIAASQAERLRSSSSGSSHRRRGSARRARFVALGSSLVALLLAGAVLAKADGSLTRTAQTQLAPLQLDAGKTLVAENYNHDHYAFFLLCRTAVADHAYADAVVLCSRSLELWPSSEPARFVRFAAALDGGIETYLVADLTALLGGSRTIRERALTICLQHPRAEAILPQAVVANPKMSYVIGRFLNQRRPDLLERLALQLRKKLPNQVFGIEVLRGDLYARRGLFRQADHIATRLMGDPGLGGYGWELQGLIYELQGRPNDALPLYDLACEALVENYTTCISAIRTAIAGLPPKEALLFTRRRFLTVRRSISSSYEYRLLLAGLLLKMQHYSDALAEARRARGLIKGAPKAVALMAQIQLHMGDWRAAQHTIDQLPKTLDWQNRRVELAAEVSATRRSGRL